MFLQIGHNARIGLRVGTKQDSCHRRFRAGSGRLQDGMVDAP